MQIKDYSIGPVITYNVEITSFRCCCINTKPVYVELTLFDVGVNWRRHFDIVMLVGLRCMGTHVVCSFAVSTKRNRFLTSYLPPLMTRPFTKGSTFKGKSPR